MTSTRVAVVVTDAQERRAEQLAQTLAEEHGRPFMWSRLDVIAPGLIYNEFLSRIYPPEFFSGYVENRSVVGRVGVPEDVATLVSFLAGPESGYVTGEVYGVSGGVHPHA